MKNSKQNSLQYEVHCININTSVEDDGYMYSSLPVGSKRCLACGVGCGLGGGLGGAIFSYGNASRPILSIVRERHADGDDEEEYGVAYPLRISLLPLVMTRAGSSSSAWSAFFRVCNASNAPFVV